MSFSATRLTCFALIAAIEEDLRAAIETYLSDQTMADLVGPERVGRAQARRQVAGLSAASSLTGLLPYLDFGDSYELLMSGKSALPGEFLASLKSIGPEVGRLVAVRNRVAHTRPMEIDDSARLVDIAKLLLDADTGHWISLAETVSRLGHDPSYVLGLTITLPKDPDIGPQHNLPIPDFDETGFFGRQEQLRRIKKAIKGAYPVVSILGDGGIGKTSIALKAAYELLEDPDQLFEVFVWVTAKATILTTNEIQRINGAIESSLGLFTHAAVALGAPEAVDAVSEVLAYMGNFRILLILDNLETVLDARLRDFLLDLPLGSKVLVTSRIGLGIENPVQLDPLSVDDSARLLRALSRIRDVAQLKSLPQTTIESLAQKMGGHPAYIRWFVAGVQAGRRPEELVGDNALLLDFCMSNVYEYLKDNARAVVRSMQVLPGARNQAELAFLNDFAAGKIQAALLELLTTNFVHMSSQPAGPTLDTVYELSDFGKQYLDKRHPVSQDERTWLLARSSELRDLGSRLTAASSATPYSAETVNVRGVGDVYVARLLREAMRQVAVDPAAAFANCAEAQLLAPSYYEAWRVEGYVRSIAQDHAGVRTAYERALELAPDSPILHFHFGTFMLNEAGEPRRGLELLQLGARLDDRSPELGGQIAWAHYLLGDMYGAAVSSRHVLSLKSATQRDIRGATVLGLRAGIRGVQDLVRSAAYDDAAELLESTVELIESVSVEALAGESLDRLIQLRSAAEQLSSLADGYVVAKASEYGARTTERQRSADASSLDRKLGFLKTFKSDKGFGFVTVKGKDFFFHFRNLIGSYEEEQLAAGVLCAFLPIPESPRGPRAEGVRVLV